jgi:hypothetical protein
MPTGICRQKDHHGSGGPKSVTAVMQKYTDSLSLPGASDAVADQLRGLTPSHSEYGEYEPSRSGNAVWSLDNLNTLYSRNVPISPRAESSDGRNINWCRCCSVNGSYDSRAIRYITPCGEETLICWLVSSYRSASLLRSEMAPAPKDEEALICHGAY